MSQRISLKIEAPEWRAVTEADLNKLRLAFLLFTQAIAYTYEHTAYFDDTHRMGWQPDQKTIDEIMSVKRYRKSWCRDPESFSIACLKMSRVKSNADAWRKRNGKPVREFV